MVRTWHFHCCGPGFNPWLGNWGTEMPQATWHGQKKNKKKKTRALRDLWDQKVPLVYISPSLVVPLLKGTGAKKGL